MNALSRNALNAYTRTDAESGAEGASPHKLILMLFDGATQAIAKAIFAILNHDVAAKCKGITHAYAIIQEGLQMSLDVKAGGDIAVNLSNLYDYMCDRLLVANVNNEIEPLNEVASLLKELRGAWAEIDERKTQSKQSAADNTVKPERTSSVSYGAA